MSSIDLVILGIVSERPQSAYEIQKDVEFHNFPRWTKISIPSVYKKVLQLKQQGYLSSRAVRSGHVSSKTVYSITARGRERFRELMGAIAAQPVPLQFDCNVVVANLNKLERSEALSLLAQLRQSLRASEQETRRIADGYEGLPLTAQAIFTQQLQVYQALLAWLDAFEARFSCTAP